MRDRLAAAFLLLALVVLVLFAGVRLSTQHDRIRDREAAHLQHDVEVLAHVVDRWTRSGDSWARAEVGPFLENGQQARIEVADDDPVVLSGDDYSSTGRDDALRARASSGSVSVTLRQSPEVVGALVRDTIPPLAALSIVLVLMAGVVGYVVSGFLSEPFRRLAVAARALARGRSDLDLPSSRIPEVRALAEALETSAVRMQREGRRDQEFLTEASHRLRTPITGMRLDLEDLQLRQDLDPEVRSTVDRSIAGLDRLEELTTGIFALARAARAGSGEVQLTVQELAQQTADTWAAALREHDATVRVHVDGVLEQQVTPGPFEQVLDLVLADLLTSTAGTVHLSITTEGEQIAVRVHCEQAVGESQGGRPALARVQATVDLLGGRSTGDPAGDGLRVWLPVL